MGIRERAIVDRIEGRAKGAKKIPEVVVDEAEFRLRAPTPGHDGLIGDDDHGKVGSIKAGDRFSDAGQEAQLVNRPDDAVLLIDDAVAVEKDGLERRSRGGRIGRFLHFLRRDS